MRRHDGSEATYRLVDGLASTANLCDEDGNLIGEYTYDAYGNVRAQSGDQTEFSFAGEQSDPNGLAFLRARYYDPEIGRFLGPDPASQPPNVYVYALGNPVTFVDPTGFTGERVNVCTNWIGGFCEGTTSLPVELATSFETRLIYNEALARGWKPVTGVDNRWVGGWHINLVNQGANIHFPVPPGWVP
jgi:RHS repeat-associated protein